MSTTYIIFAFVLAVIIVFLLTRSPKVDRSRQNSVSATDRTEQRILTDDEIRKTLLRGDKIQAIKMYRELHGVGLAEAKEAVEAME